MKLKITYESGDEIVTITWTPEYGFDIAGNKTIVDKFTTEEIQPRGQAVAQAHPVPVTAQHHVYEEPDRPNVGTVPEGDATSGQVVVTRDGKQVWVDPEDLTEEEQEAAEEAQAAIDKAIAEAAGDPDDAGDGEETPTPAAMPKKRGAKKARPKPKCQACNHAWHGEECEVLIGTGQTKQPCGCLTAVM